MSNIPTLEWLSDIQTLYLRFTFGESFSHDDATIAISQWREAFASRPGEMITLIWDCTAMKDYHGSAKSIWTASLRDFDDQIEMIWMISGSSLVRIGATFMARMAQIPFKSVRSEAEIFPGMRQDKSWTAE